LMRISAAGSRKAPCELRDDVWTGFTAVLFQ